MSTVVEPAIPATTPTTMPATTQPTHAIETRGLSLWYGDFQAIKDVTIDPDAVDPEDAEMLAEMVQAAVNEAIRAAQQLAASKMPDVPGMPGLGGGGLPGG